MNLVNIVILVNLVILVKLVNLVILVSGDSDNPMSLMNLVILATPKKRQNNKTKRCERKKPRPYSSPTCIGPHVHLGLAAV